MVKLLKYKFGKTGVWKVSELCTKIIIGECMQGICFDLCDANEFPNVLQWMQEVDRYARENIPVIIIGTKCEQFNLLCVDFETIRNFCLSHEVQYFECSSKLNINVEDLFESMARKVVELEEKAKRERETPNTILVRKVKPKKNCAFQ